MDLQKCGDSVAAFLSQCSQDQINDLSELQTPFFGTKSKTEEVNVNNEEIPNKDDPSSSSSSRNLSAFQKFRTQSARNLNPKSNQNKTFTEQNVHPKSSYNLNPGTPTENSADSNDINPLNSNTLSLGNLDSPSNTIPHHHHPAQNTNNPNQNFLQPNHDSEQCRQGSADKSAPNSVDKDLRTQT